MFNKRLVYLVIVFVALAALIAACGPGASGGGGGGGTNEVNVTLTATEFKYDPNTITASPGQKVNVTLVNKGTVIHTFVLPEAGITSSNPIKAEAGKTATGSFTAPAAGTYTFYCDQPGHKEAGMTGTLTVK
jgi:plastocyanin